MSTGLAVRLLLSVCGLVALALLGWGLTKTVHFERTPLAVANERTGHLLILSASVALAVIAALVSRSAPTWVAVTVAAPAVLCGGLTLLAGETFLPQLAAPPAFILAVAGLIGLLVDRSP